MAEAVRERVTMKTMDQVDLVRHHYNRRALWGTDSVLYRREHPMLWKSARGNYQNWEVDTNRIVPSDTDLSDGEPTRLFYSDDLTLWLSRRRQSMPYFARNCNADELHLISRGAMTYETDFGTVEVKERDFLVIPKGITYRVLVDGPQDTLRMIYESRPEIFLVPTEMVDHVYGKGRPAVDPARVQAPRLAEGPPPQGPFAVRVKYEGAFSDFLGETSTLVYDFYPLDTEIVDGEQHVFKFSATDIEKLGTTPVPFLGGAYLDNRTNLAWTLHVTGGGGRAPVHRNVDVDELRYHSSGPMMGHIEFTPQGVDHGAGRGYTRIERNRAEGPYDVGDVFSIYTFKPLKGTAEAYRCAVPCVC